MSAVTTADVSILGCVLFLGCAAATNKKCYDMLRQANTPNGGVACVLLISTFHLLGELLYNKLLHTKTTLVLKATDP